MTKARKGYELAVVAVLAAAILITTGSRADAVVYLNQAALSAVEMQETLTYQLQRYVEFLRYSLAYISPTPETGMSIVKGSQSQNRFAKLFRDLEHNKKSQSEEEEMWRELLETEEGKSIDMIHFAIDPFGQEVFGREFPTQTVPFATGRGKFTFRILSLRYIVPAHSGIIIAAPGEIDKSIRDYLLASQLFFLIVTVEIPIAKEVQDNYFYEEICASVRRKVPEAYFLDNVVRLTVFPTVDKMHSIIQTIRNSMYQGLAVR